jgi:ParB-like chromosome segregation protein Spo0J
MIDSLIENIHREDLSPTEKGKFCLKIKKQMKLENNEQVANLLKINKIK